MMSVRLVAANVLTTDWYAVIDVRDPATGRRKRKWHSLEAEGKREAQIECANLISAIKKGTYIEANKITIREFISHWLVHIRPQIAPRTFERYEEIANKNITPMLGAIIVGKLKPMQISDAYARALVSGRRDGKGGLSARSVGHIHRVLRQALGQAVRWEMLIRNPADSVDPPKVEWSAMKTYDLGQTAVLIEALRGSRMFIPVLLAVLCGLRRGEIAALRWGRIDLSAGQLSVVESAEQSRTGVRYKPPKSGKGRTVALPTTLIEELKAYRVRQAQALLRIGIRLSGATFVCAREDREPLQPEALTIGWERAVAKTALPRVRFHDLRHAHATHLLASGVHPKIASERLGHSKVGITLDLYSHVIPGMQEDAAAKLDAALRAAQNDVKKG
jgi:integrase